MKRRLPLLIYLTMLLVTIACGTSAPNLQATQVAQDKATMEALATAVVEKRETEEAPSATSTTLPTPASTTVVATLTPHTALTPSVTVGQIGGQLPVSGMRVTLCGKIMATPPGEPAKCIIGEFEQSAVTDDGGHFQFPAIPAGAYYIWFDIPEALKDTALRLCRDGEFRGRDYLSEGGAREFCLDATTLGPTVVVEAGKTTVYSPAP
jgi:hypothetical protein